MPIKMRIASTTEEIDSVFLLRHKVFAEQENILEPNRDKRFMDRFDTFPSTVQLVATLGDETVGAFRFSIDDVCGLPADEYYDFRQFVDEDAKLMHAGMFCVHRDYRAEKIAVGLILMAAYYAISNQITHVVAPINPHIAPLLRRIGFKKVGEKFYDEHIKYDIVPLMMEAAELNDFFVDFVRQNQLHDFLMDYERWFCKKEEQIVEAGTFGHEAFIIIDGEVEIRVPGEEQVLATLGPGEMFGELAIITNEARSADVFAKTEVQMMVMSKEIFMKRFIEDSNKALILMRMLSRRSQNMIMHLKYGHLGRDSALQENPQLSTTEEPSA